MNTKFKFAVVSDTHLNSKYCQLNALIDFYKMAKEEGCELVLHAGDIIDGERIYKGQEQEIINIGFEKQIEYLNSNYPDDLPTYFICGNHDLGYHKLCGVNVGEIISSLNQNLIFLSDDEGDLELNNVWIRLWHGCGSGAYALSYKTQKYINELPPGQKPRILLVGHWHQYNHIFYRNVDAFLCGSFQGYTRLTKRLGVHPVICGLILTMEIDSKGQLIGLENKNIYFYLKRENILYNINNFKKLAEKKIEENKNKDIDEVIKQNTPMKIEVKKKEKESENKIKSIPKKDVVFEWLKNNIILNTPNGVNFTSFFEQCMEKNQMNISLKQFAIWLNQYCLNNNIQIIIKDTHIRGDRKRYIFIKNN